MDTLVHQHGEFVRYSLRRMKPMQTAKQRSDVVVSTGVADELSHCIHDQSNKCCFVFQAEEWSESEWQMPAVSVCNEENPLIAEAYHDPHLQPVVTMTRLTQAQYVNTFTFEEVKLP